MTQKILENRQVNSLTTQNNLKLESTSANLSENMNIWGCQKKKENEIVQGLHIKYNK